MASHSKNRQRRWRNAASVDIQKRQDSDAGHAERRGGRLARDALMRLVASDLRFKIAYIVPHETQDLGDASPLGWYTPGLHDAALPLLMASSLPSDIREPYAAPENVLPLRQLRATWPFITPLQIGAVHDVDRMLPTPFRVYISMREPVAEAIDAIMRQSSFPSLHVSACPAKGRMELERFKRDLVMEYVEGVLLHLQDEPNWAGFVVEARRAMQPCDLQPIRNHSLPRGSHNVLVPNEIALAAFGFHLHVDDPLVKDGGRWPSVGDYVRRICGSADAVFDMRAQLLEPRNDLIDYRYILAVPSFWWGHYAHYRQRLQRLEQLAPNSGVSTEFLRIARLSYLAAIRQKTYFDRIEMSDTEKQIPLLAELSREVAADRRSFTAGLAYLASASLAPVLRLEPKLNEVRGDLKLLAGCVRKPGMHHHHWKRSRQVRQLGSKMRSLIDSMYLDRIDRDEQGHEIEGMKLVCDLPLEWLPTKGLPLSLRFDTSRLPVMPGNMYLANCVSRPVTIPVSAFSEVLIIRSFTVDDPLRGVLEDQIRADAAIASMVRIVDVSNEDEFVEALAGYKGACLIFDGHGAYEEDDGAGQIVLGGKTVNAWNLRERCSLPPIVIFSACDTQPLDGAHTSSAIGAFVLGARTVLGTSLPIDGKVAATFIRRLLLRVREFVPAALTLRPVVTWREVVSGLLRMAHVTDILLLLHSNGVARVRSVDDLNAVSLAANIAINHRRSDWYETFLSAYSERCGLPIGELQDKIGKFAALTESMKYVQLGAPENIIITGDVPEEVMRREAQLLLRAASA